MVEEAQGDCVAIVPVSVGDRQAPAGAAALRVLHGVPLLSRAISALAHSGVVGQVVVAAPASLVPAITQLLGNAAAAAVPFVRLDIIATPGPGPGHRIRAALQFLDALPGSARLAPGDVVVVHDPLHALASAALTRSVAQALAEAAGPITSAVPVRLVTDTLKWVDEDEVIESTFDRDQFRMVYSPQAHRWGPLLAALTGATREELLDDGAAALPRMMHRHGGQMVSVPAPAEVFRIVSVEDIQLAEAMLHVEAGARPH